MLDGYREALDPAAAGERRLGAVVELTGRSRRETAASVAGRHGMSRQQLYELQGRAARALAPRRPGPRPGARAEARLRKEVAALRAQVAGLKADLARAEADGARRVEVTERRRAQLELVCFAENVSLRGTQAIFEVAYGEDHRPELAGLHGRMKERGCVARRLLDDGRAQVQDKLRCVMADDVFFHRSAVKVVAEPESVAILDVGRWEGRSGEDWALWFERYPSLELVVADLGTDIVGATEQLGLAHQADFFHEMRWFDQKLFWPLSGREEQARAAWWEALEGATRIEGPGRRVAPAKVEEVWAEVQRAESDFFAAVEAVDLVRTLYEPVNPATGRIWTEAEVQATRKQVEGKLSSIDHAAARRAARHLRAHGHRYAAHLSRIDAVPVQLREGSAWTDRAVINAVLRLRALRRQLLDPDAWGDHATWHNRRRLAEQIERRLRRECVDLDVVANALARELAFPKRSSSAVESLNSRLRVLQMVHRKVSDEMLALAALAWNLSPRTLPSRRRGRSPYQMLGVDLGQATRPWFDVLLDAADARTAA